MSQKPITSVNKKSFLVCLKAFKCALGGIRTPDLLVRSQTLYPTELQAHGIGFSNQFYNVEK